MQKRLLLRFATHENVRFIDAVPEQRVRDSSETIRVYVLYVLRSDTPHESVTLTPPLLCIEICSPEDRPSRIKRVFSDYYQIGGPQHLPH